jgi:cell wall-associated NlpC family hydrolase
MPRPRKEGWLLAPGVADMGSANGLRSAARSNYCGLLALPPEGSLPVSERLRFALLVLVLVAFVSARAGGALGGTDQIGLTTHAEAVHEQAVREQTQVVAYARHLLGVPYVYGGTSRQGFDCSGFTRFVYAHFGVTLPHYSVAQFQRGHRVGRASLRPGDLVFFDGLGHVGLYIGRGRFIHAPHTGTRVSVATLSGWYASRYDGARRLL